MTTESNNKTSMKPSKNRVNSSINNNNNICQLCPLTVTGKLRPGLSCYSCNKPYHASCLNIPAESLKTLKDMEVNWSCSKCKPRISSRRSTIYAPPPETAPASSPKELTSRKNTPEQSRLSESVAKLQEFQKAAEPSLTFLSSKLDEVLAEITELKKSHKKCELLVKENESLKTTIKQLESKFDNIEQQQNVCDLLVTGLPELEIPGKDATLNVVREFTQHIGYQLDKNQIKYCSRLPHSVSENEIPSTSSAPPIKRPAKILVKFHSTQQKEHLKTYIRTYKKSNKTVTFKNQKVNFYACDHLSKQLNNIFTAAKTTAKAKNYSFVWVNDSRIFVKKCNTSPTIPIKTVEDLRKIN